MVVILLVEGREHVAGRKYLTSSPRWSLNSAFKLWITLEAGQRLGEDRRSGAFELLLATPLTVSDILRGQWIALRRQFLKPLLVVIAAELVFIAAIRQRAKENGLLMILAMLIALPFDLFALVWASMLAALTAKSQMKATMFAVSRILILPWVFLGLLVGCAAVYNWLLFRSWNPSEHDETVAWVILSLAVDATYGVWAWRSVRREFRLMATQTWNTPEPKRDFDQSGWHMRSLAHGAKSGACARKVNSGGITAVSSWSWRERVC